MRIRSFLLLAVIFFSVPCFADIIIVDPAEEGSHATIQGGINAAVDGDVVVVAEGYYKERINFHGKDVILRSTAPDDPEVAAGTVLNGLRLSVAFMRTKKRENVYTKDILVAEASVVLGGGSGIESDPFIVSTASDWVELSNNSTCWSRHFRMEADIDLAGVAGDYAIVGTETIPFTGVFDGNGHTISNFSYSTDAMEEYIGLFGQVYDTDARVKNLGLINTFIDAPLGGYIGSLVGQVLRGRVENCYVINCDVNGANSVGGLIGFTSSYTFVTDSYAKGDVTGVRYVGGFMGYNRSFLERCYSVADVVGEDIVGGFAGTDGETIKDSFSQGSVFGTIKDVGGFIGLSTSYKKPSLRNCYSTCSVSAGPGTRYVGGLVGRYGSTVGYTAGCYWDTQASGQSSSDGGMGRTTSSMQSQFTFSGWDFSGIWSICGSNYPRLSSNPINVDAGADRFMIDVPLEVVLDGSDSCSPYAAIGQLLVEWRQIGGPSVVIDDSTSILTSFVPAVEGIYEFELEVGDGISAFEIDSVMIQIGNEPPYVDSGDDQSCLLNDTISVVPVVSDDGFPAGVVAVLWEKVSGPGSVTFTPSATSENVTISFSVEGSYEIRLTADDSDKISSDEILVEVVSYGGGSGSGSDPYLIYTARQMWAVSLIEKHWDKTFMLMADVDLSGYDGLGNRPVFDPIGSKTNPFTGDFDGNGHSISNFRFVAQQLDSAGLFGYVAGYGVVIEDLGLIDPYVEVTTASGVGGLIGTLADGNGHQITNCYVRGGSVTGNYTVAGLVGGIGGHIGISSTITQCYTFTTVSGYDNVGGLVGNAGNANINYCFTKGSISAVRSAGGLVALNSGNPIYNCYSECSVSGDDDSGGFVGYSSSGAVISKCYSRGPVSGAGAGFVGTNLYGTVPYINTSFWDVETSGKTVGVNTGASDGVQGKTTYDMQRAQTFTDAGWNFISIWTIDEGNDWPRLWWEAPNTVPVADAGYDVELPADGDCVATILLDGSGSTDADGDALSYKWYYEGALLGEGVQFAASAGPGLHEFTLIVNDGREDSASDSVFVTVTDETGPAFSVRMSRRILWPVNDQMILVSPIFDAIDNCGGNVDISLVGVTCNQGGEEDYVIDGLNVSLRAKRVGNEMAGQIYTITYRATDEVGNESIGTATVRVPHDQGRRRTFRLRRMGFLRRVFERRRLSR